MSDSSADKRAVRIHVNWILTGIVLFLAAHNVVMTQFFVDNDRVPDWVESFFLGTWVIQPLLFSIWIALGPGWILVRASLAVPCLLILLALPTLFVEDTPDMQQFEFISFGVACVLVCLLGSFVLLLLRRIFQWRITTPDSRVPSEETRVQFDIKFLIMLITLYAMMLGVLSNVKFKPANSNGNIFGPEFYLQVIAMGGATFFILLLPILAVPLLTLRSQISKRAIVWSLATWLAFTAATIAFWLWAGEGTAIPFFLSVQLGGVTAAFLTAFALRLAGCRLVRLARQPAEALTTP